MMSDSSTAALRGSTEDEQFFEDPKPVMKRVA